MCNADGPEDATSIFGDVGHVEGVVWSSDPELTALANDYEVTEIRLLGDGDLIVVSPTSG
jgi:hypothetical protein